MVTVSTIGQVPILFKKGPASYPISSNGKWLSGVEVLPTIKDRFLIDKVVCMALDQGLHYLPVHPARTLVRNNGHIVVVEDTVWNLHLQGGGEPPNNNTNNSLVRAL